MMRVIVTRAFLVKGERQEVGSELDVADAFGYELIHAGKAAIAGAAPEAPRGPLTTETAPAVVAGAKPRKGKP